MEVHKAFEEAILRAKNQPNLTTENQAQLFALHQQATAGDYSGTFPGQTDENHLNAWAELSGLTPDEARMQYINYVAQITKQNAG